MPKTVGVLGGMGPYATAAFFQTVLSLTPAKKDWDHLRIVIDNNPKIPSRSRHLLYGERSPLPGMIEACLRLQSYPVDFIAVPCNSAAVLVPELQAELATPVLNIIEITANELAARYPTARKAAAVGGRVTYATRSYEPFLAVYGIELVDHGEDLQAEVERQIEDLKLGRKGNGEVGAAERLVARLKADFAVDVVIFACTEFGCLPDLDVATPIVDSSLELARETVRLGLP